MTDRVLTWVECEGVPLLVDQRAAEDGLTVAFTGRLGGCSPAPFRSLNLSTMVGDDVTNVRANRAAAAVAAGFEPDSMVLPKQVHGAVVVEVRDGAPGPVAECDALVAADDAVTVGVLTADCVPILMSDGTRSAAVHAGWRGLVAGVIEAAADRLVRPVERAWVGPSIRGCCYEVGPEVVEAFRVNDLPVVASDRVDPGRAALSALTKIGVEDVVAASECTSCDDRFFSHRRDGRTGRQGAFIGRAR